MPTAAAISIGNSTLQAGHLVEGEIDGLDCSLADGGDVVWVAELGLLPAATTAS